MEGERSTSSTMRHPAHPGPPRALLAAGAALVLLALAPAAHAATVSASSSAIDYRAGAGEANHLTIAPWGMMLKVTESGTRSGQAVALTVGSGCWRVSTTSAACPDVPAHVNLGDGNDVVDLRDGVTDTLVCGPGLDSGDAETADGVGADCETVAKPAVTPDPVVEPPTDPVVDPPVVDPPVVDPPVVDPPVVDPAIVDPPGNSVPPSIPPQTVGISAGGVASVLVACPADSGGCKGVVAITLPAAAGRRRAGGARLVAAKRGVALKIGSARFKAAAGTSKTVRVRLSKRGRQRILRGRSRRARISVTTRSAAGSVAVTTQDVTLRPPKAKKRKARR
jgi:hypothetical protein